MHIHKWQKISSKIWNADLKVIVSALDNLNNIKGLSNCH